MTSREWVCKFGQLLQRHYGIPFEYNSYKVYDKTLLLHAFPGDVYIIKNVLKALWSLSSEIQPDSIILLLGNKGQFVCYTYSHLCFIKDCATFDAFYKTFLQKDRISMIGMYFDYNMREFFDWMTSFEKKNYSCIPKKYLKNLPNVPYVESSDIKPISTQKRTFRRKIYISPQV